MLRQVSLSLVPKSSSSFASSRIIAVGSSNNAAANVNRAIVGANNNNNNNTKRWMMITAKQKRALTKKQIEGSSSSSTGSSTLKLSPTPPPPTIQADSNTTNSSLLFGGVAVIAIGGGVAYYVNGDSGDNVVPVPATEQWISDQVPDTETASSLSNMEDLPLSLETVVSDAVVVEEEKEKEKTEESVVEKTDESANEEAQIMALLLTEALTEENEVVAAKEDTIIIEQKSATEKDNENGSDNNNNNTAVPTECEKVEQPITKNLAEDSTTKEENKKEVVVQPLSFTSSSIVDDSIRELQLQSDQMASETIKRAQREITNSFDATLFHDLDQLTSTQLKARVIQLAIEMKERTKWEAVRLKEFLAMKERESADNYLEIIQKQRIGFENVLAEKLRAQHHESALETNRVLQAKDLSIREEVERALGEQSTQLQQETKAALEKTEQDAIVKCQQLHLEEMSTFKQEIVQKLTQKNDKIKTLDQRLKKLKSALDSIQNYQSGSFNAHRISAAAIALAEKLETNKSAVVELEALQTAVSDNSVIAAALSSISKKVVKKGVPTIDELRTRFVDSIESKTRQAINVPESLTGTVEGQLLGMLFTYAKFPTTTTTSSNNEKEAENPGSSPDDLLSRARQYIELGQLENAIEQLSKLEGQAAFTVSDWKQGAVNRSTINKALKVIKMECALLNEDMTRNKK